MVRLWTQEETENLQNLKITEENNSLHIEEIRRTSESGQIYRSLYVISTGELIGHEKLKETIKI